MFVPNKATEFKRALSLAFTLAVTGLSLAAEPPVSPPANGGLAAKLQPFIEQQVIAGAVVIVADKEKVLDLEAVGYSDGPAKKPMQTADLFYIASMTKVFTAAGLMMLVDEGKVSLADPVEKYLPEFKGQMVEENGKRYAPQHPITIKEVMNHTAGLAAGTQVKANDTLANYVKAAAALPLAWEPGSKYKYSIGPAVGGRIIEVVSGIPYAQFIQQRLLDPLGLKDTTFWPNSEQAARLALTHTNNPATKKLEPFHHVVEAKAGQQVPPQIVSQFGAQAVSSYLNHFANPAGGLFSTATDISIFCRMLLNGGTSQGKRYLSEAAVKQMGSIQTGDLLVSPDLGYGIGCFVQKKQLPGGPSVGSFGHHGARKTQMWIDPQNGLVMALMVQCAELEHEQEKALFSAYRNQAIAKYGKANR